MCASRYALIAASIILCGCKDSLLDRSLIFSTHTALGLEISINPTETTAGPVKLLVGYNRTEGVINPVYHSEGVNAPASTVVQESIGADGQRTTRTPVIIDGQAPEIQRYRREAFSVLAKFAGKVKGNAQNTADGTIVASQWFATGEAAKILAKQPGIAGAISDNAAIYRAAMQLNSELLGGEASGVSTLIWDLYSISSDDPRIAKFRDQVDRAVSEIKLPESYNVYRTAQGELDVDGDDDLDRVTVILVETITSGNAPAAWMKEYDSLLLETIQSLTPPTGLTDQPIRMRVGNELVPITQELQSLLQHAINEAETARARLRIALGESSALAKAVHELCGALVNEEGPGS